MAVTTDNASNMESFALHLENICDSRGLMFNKENNHVHCFAHVINLASQDTLKHLHSTPHDNENAALKQNNEQNNGVLGNILKKVLTSFSFLFTNWIVLV